LHDLLARRAGELSAGQKTRVALAKSLITPARAAAGEPTAALTPTPAILVRSWLGVTAPRGGCTILLASHNMGEVERLCLSRADDEAGPHRRPWLRPTDLLERYGRDDLEDVFLDIARNGPQRRWRDRRLRLAGAASGA